MFVTNFVFAPGDTSSVHGVDGHGRHATMSFDRDKVFDIHGLERNAPLPSEVEVEYNMDSVVRGTARFPCISVGSAWQGFRNDFYAYCLVTSVVDRKLKSSIKQYPGITSYCIDGSTTPYGSVHALPAALEEQGNSIPLIVGLESARENMTLLAAFMALRDVYSAMRDYSIAEQQLKPLLQAIIDPLATDSVKENWSAVQSILYELDRSTHGYDTCNLLKFDTSNVPSPEGLAIVRQECPDSAIQQAVIKGLYVSTVTKMLTQIDGFSARKDALKKYLEEEQSKWGITVLEYYIPLISFDIVAAPYIASFSDGDATYVLVSKNVYAGLKELASNE